MYIILRRVGIIEVDDKLNILDVKASRRHVSSHKYGSRAVPELGEHGVTLLLRFVAMDSQRLVACAADRSGYVIYLQIYYLLINNLLP